MLPAVNSQSTTQTRVPYTALHFGYPGKTRFYSWGAWERFFRIWPGNPERLADGTWRSNEGSAQVFFTLKHELKPLYLAAYEEDMKSLPQASAAAAGKIAAGKARL